MSKPSSAIPWLIGGGMLAGGLLLASQAKADEACQAGSPLGQLCKGWYWAILADVDTARFEAFRAQNPGALLPRKTTRAQLTSDHVPPEHVGSWILFEVTRPVLWTLPGRPSFAPKGFATTPAETLGIGDGSATPAITSPEHPWNEFWSGTNADGLNNPLVSAVKTLDKAVPILIYGGVGVLLWKLWGLVSAVSPSTSPSRALPSPAYRALPAGRD